MSSNKFFSRSFNNYLKDIKNVKEELKRKRNLLNQHFNNLDATHSKTIILFLLTSSHTLRELNLLDSDNREVGKLIRKIYQIIAKGIAVILELELQDHLHHKAQIILNSNSILKKEFIILIK